MAIWPITTIMDVVYPTKRLLTIFTAQYEVALKISCHPFLGRFLLHKSATYSS